MHTQSTNEIILQGRKSPAAPKAMSTALCQLLYVNCSMSTAPVTCLFFSEPKPITQITDLIPMLHVWRIYGMNVEGALVF